MPAGTLRADGLLLLTAIIWGFAFSAQRSGMEHIGPFAYTGIRFALGALSMLPLFAAARMRSRGTRARTVADLSADHGAPVAVARAARPLTLPRKALVSTLVGMVLFAGSALQQIGLVTTTAGNAGFITCLYVVIVPFLGFLVGKRSSPRIWAGAALALAGLYVLSVGAGFVVAAGDLFVLAGSFFWALHILVLAKYANRMDPPELALGQYLVCSILSLFVAVIVEPTPFAGILPAAVPILYGGILSIGVAFTLQIVAQKTAHPAHASIILSMAAIFAEVGGVLVLEEPVTLRLVAGGALMLAGMLLSRKTE